MFVLRTPDNGDVPALADLAVQTFLDGWGPVVGHNLANRYANEHLNGDRLRAEISQPHIHVFRIACDPFTHRIVGYVKMQRNRDPHASVIGARPLLLQRLYVAAEARGIGVADALLEAAEAYARQNGFETLWLECDPANHRAWRFYIKRGFVERGQVEYLLPGGSNDNVRVMERSIQKDNV